MIVNREFNYYRKLIEISLKGTNACMFILDVATRKYVYCVNTEQIYGIKADEMLDKLTSYNCLTPEEYTLNISREFTHPEDWGERGASFDKVLRGEEATYIARQKSADNRYKWCKIKLCPLSDGDCLKEVIVMCYDIDELKKAQLKIDRIEGIDEFTGGFNKVKFFEEVRDFLKNNRSGNHAFIILDLDDFKDINDTYGHARGDLVLIGVARELLSLAKRYGGYFGRFGGDEFILFLPDYSSLSRLKKLLCSLVSFEIEDVCVNASVGAAIYEGDDRSAEELFLMADTALYNSKHLGKKRYSFYCETDFEITRIKR